MGRELTFSDPRIIGLLNERFVPVAANISYLQRQDDEEGRFLRLISWQGRYDLSYEDARARMEDTKHGLCHQGQFVATTEGELLGSRHTRDADQVLEMMHKALGNWERRKTQHGRSRIGEVEQPDTRVAWQYPEGGMVLHTGCRDLPRQLDLRSEKEKIAHNQDYAWITREEMLSIVPEGVQAGDRFPVPGAIARRLARFHLLDSVRGETSAWAAEAVRNLEMTLTATEVTPERVEAKLTGRALLHEDRDWCTHPPRTSPYRRGEMCCLINDRGYEANLLGYVSFNRAEGRFARFDAVAVGTRWGGTTFNGRREDVEPAPLGVAMTLAGSLERDRTPPHANAVQYFQA